MRIAVNALAGLIFGLGLLISGMANPAKVQNFLDFAGTFDPSLIFVMGGAVAVTFLGYRLAFTRQRPVLVERFSLPTAKEIEPRVRHRLGFVGFLSRPRDHLASIACEGHARLCAGDAARHRRGASLPPGEAIGQILHGGSERSLAKSHPRFSLSLDRTSSLPPFSLNSIGLVV
jgi:hypothetical protein